MSVFTRKFSEFIAGGLNNSNKVVGLSGGANAIFEDPSIWTTATRPTMPTDGLLGYNSTLGQYEYFNAGLSAWVQLISNASDINWSTITVSTPAVLNNGYVTNGGGVVEVTLPLTMAVGDRVKVLGRGSGGWKVTANAGQLIYFGNQLSSTAGAILSSNQYDNVEVTCLSVNTEWQVTAVIGNLTII